MSLQKVGGIWNYGCESYRELQTVFTKWQIGQDYGTQWTEYRGNWGKLREDEREYGLSLRQRYMDKGHYIRGKKHTTKKQAGI